MSSPSITTAAPAYEARTVTETTTGLELFGDDKTVVAVRVNGEVRDLHLPAHSTGSGTTRSSRSASSRTRAWPSCDTRPRTCWRRPSRPRHSDAKTRHRAADHRRLLLRLRRGRAVHPRGPEEPREGDDPDRQGAAALSSAGWSPTTRPATELAAEPYKLELIADKGCRDAPTTRCECRGRRRRADHLRQPAPRRLGRLEGPVPRSARAAHRLHPGVRADPGLRGVLARRPGQPPAAADLRHRLAEPGRAEGLPVPAGRGRQARPPQARPRARPVLLPRRDRLGAGRVPPQGRHAAQGDGGPLPAAPRRGRLRVRQHPAHHQGGAVRDLGPPRLLRRRHVPADAPRRGAPPRRPAASGRARTTT